MWKYLEFGYQMHRTKSTPYIHTYTSAAWRHEKDTSELHHAECAKYNSNIKNEKTKNKTESIRTNLHCTRCIGMYESTQRSSQIRT